MPDLDRVGIFIEALHKQMGPRHPLYGREVFPLAVRRDPNAVIYETDDEARIYVMVYWSWSFSDINRKRRGNPKTEVLADWQAIQTRMELDAAKWLAQFR